MRFAVNHSLISQAPVVRPEIGTEEGVQEENLNCAVLATGMDTVIQFFCIKEWSDNMPPHVAPDLSTKLAPLYSSLCRTEQAPRRIEVCCNFFFPEISKREKHGRASRKGVSLRHGPRPPQSSPKYEAGWS